MWHAGVLLCNVSVFVKRTVQFKTPPSSMQTRYMNIFPLWDLEGSVPTKLGQVLNCLQVSFSEKETKARDDPCWIKEKHLGS